MKQIISMILLSVFVLSIVGCTQGTKPIDKETFETLQEINDTQGSTVTIAATQAIKKFNSVQEIRDFLKQSNSNSGYDTYAYRSSGRNMVLTESMADAAVPMAKAVASSQAAGGAGASDYSQTNIQVEGVDEADFVKNDNKYIYVLSQEELVIVDAYPANEAKILSKTDIEGRPSNLFINKDRLVVFSVVEDEAFTISEFDYRPTQRYAPRTHAYVYDISNKEEPKLLNDFNVNGDYYEARMIGDHVYFIAKDPVYYYNNFIDTPVLRNGAEKVLMPDVFYFDNPDQNFVFHTIASFDINSDDNLNAKTFMMGYSNTLYVSENNIYIAYQRNMPWRYYETANEDRFYKVVVPLLPSDVQSKISDIKNSDISSAEKWQNIASDMEDMYNSMDEDDKDELIKKIDEKVEEYETKLEIERRKTIIHRIAIDKGNIEYGAKGEVSGYLLNQFSLDENSGNLRVATTTEVWTRSKNNQFNNVYVLDKDMKQIGDLEELAPDERIYSTRFMGDRLYMVTFKRVDPLFVIDLSDARNPKVLGELKIPGFSDYLHPYDENHIIGIGKETAENEWGGISTKGLKLALFDVSNVEKPKQIAQYEIGTSGSDSEALHEHKAFLFDKEKELLVIPVREVKESKRYNSRFGYYEQRVWQGAYVFNLNPSDGFELKGKISHNDDIEESRWYWGSPYAVRRSLFMDDTLYTISAKKIMANDLDDIDTELKEIKLPFSQDKYYPYY